MDIFFVLEALRANIFFNLISASTLTFSYYVLTLIPGPISMKKTSPRGCSSVPTLKFVSSKVRQYKNILIASSNQKKFRFFR